MSTQSWAVTDGVRPAGGTTTNTVIVRQDGGANVGTRGRLNFITGANVTLTVADDPADAEIDITVASAGGAAAGYIKQFYPAIEPTSTKGYYSTINMPDLVDTDIWHTFMMPSDLVTITRAVVIVIPEAAGNIYWECYTNFAGMCANKAYDEHNDAVAAGASTVTDNEVECLSIAGALTGAVGLDLVGLKFTRLGSSISDTIGNAVHYVGVLIEGTT
jgi:hypothetical protein